LKKHNRYILISVLLFSAVILTLYSKEANEYARDALKVCALSVIPSLFPYMVISNLIVRSGALSFLGRLFPISRLFSLPAHATAPIILGAVCGFPIGAKSAAAMYENGQISKSDAEVLISCANNTGPSFVVSVIGGAFWKSLRFGWELYIFQLLSSLISALLVNRIILPHKSSNLKAPEKSANSLDLFSAVCDSVSSVLSVCGFIVFFSVISGFALPFVSRISPNASVFLSAILEFCQGTRLAASIGGLKGRFLTGLAVGFSGISVFCQTAAFTERSGLSLRRLTVTKVMQGLICGAMCAFLSTPGNIQSGGEYPHYYEYASVVLSSPIPCSLICTALFIILIKNLVNDHKI